MSKGKAGVNLKGFYILFGAVGLIGIGAVGYSVGSKALGTAAMEPVDLEGVGDNNRLLLEMAVPMTEGDENAPVTIAVFEDYFCSHCAAFSIQELPLVESEYVETGKARIKLYDFVLDPRPEAGTFLAARAARCAADQDRFWDYHERLYRSQMRWGGESDKLGVFQQYAEDLGLDGSEFGACLNSDRHAREVSANIELAHALGIGGTPTVLVGTEGGMSRRLPNYAFETIKEAVDGILGGGTTN